MGVDTRKPPLPAPTDPSTLSEATAESVAPTDLATDLSRRTDRTSYSVPEDGSPVTISTRKKRGERRKENESTLTRATHNSQTSLLIEYFEGGKGGKTIQSRPSVRVKVTPSAARKIKDTNDHIQISETSKSRKPSYTRRISLGPNAPGEKLITESGDDKSLSSYASATEESNLTSRNPPIEIEVMHKDHGSPLSATSRDARYTYAHASDISSMPPDSFLDGHDGSRTPRRRRSRSLNRDEVVIKTDTLKTPSRRRSRSLSRERITQKVIEKIVRPRETSGKHKHSNSRSRSASKEHVFESTKSPRRRSSRSHREEEFTSGAESSLLTTSQLSGSRKSGDQYSFRSGTSKSSINNPKLLETVEDAIRRLILPELTALKHEQSQHGRSKHEKGNRDSFVTTSSVSEDQSRPHLTKVSSASDVAAKPKVVLNRSDHDPGMTLSGNSVKGRKERHEQRRDSTSERSFSYDRDVSEDTVIRDDGKADKKRSKERHSGREAAPRVTSGGSLTAAALKSHDSKSSLDRRERRKKRSKSGSRSASVAESEEPYHRGEIPPMPFSSDIHGSELTRDSILSERVEHSHEETSPRGLGNRVREVSRGSPREVLSPASRTPTRTPVQKGLGMHHSNLSRGDLSVHSGQSDRSIRNSGHHKALEAGLAGAGVGAGVAALVDEQNQHHHTLPDYEANLERSYAQRHQNRGLSPIQSVASYRDDGTDPPNRDSFRHTHSTGSLSSLGPEGLEQRRNSEMSIKSLSSARSTNFARSRRPQGINLEKSDGIIPTDVLPGSELMHDERMSKDAGIEQWYDQQHQENDRYRSSMDDDGFRNSTIDVRHMTNYTDDSLDAPYLGNVTAGQQVVDIGANPEYRHTPVAVESAVASLLDASMVDSSRSGKSKVGERAYADSITGGHPEAADYYEGSDRGLTASQRGSPLKQRHNARSLEARSRSGKSLRQEATANSPRLSKGRSMEEQVEHIPMGASGLPVADDPLPEIGHGLSDESDINTNPSIIQGPIGGVQHGSRDHWPYEPTPPQSNGNLLAGGHAHDNQDIKAAELGLLGAAAGAGLGAVGHHQSSLDQEQHDREFQERYSKQANVEDDYERGVNQDVGSRADSYTGGNEMLSPPYKEPKDEGYISAANPRSPGGVTPEPQDKRAQLFGDDGMAGIDDVMGGDDPFVSQSHARHLSGYSHGMPSPLYDSSTGKGIDRIQSKDVVALMDHVSVDLWCTFSAQPLTKHS